MLRRFQDFVYTPPWSWVWALAWGVLLAVLLIALFSTPVWEGALVGAVFFVAVGFIRTRQGRRRGREAQ